MAYICHPSPLAGQPPPAPLYYRNVYNSSLAEGVEFLGHQNSLEDPNLRFQISLLIAICSTNVPGVLTMEATFRAHKRRIIRLWIINTFQNKTSCNEMFPLLIKLTVRWKKGLERWSRTVILLRKSDFSRVSEDMTSSLFFFLLNCQNIWHHVETFNVDSGSFTPLLIPYMLHPIMFEKEMSIF